jgi:hypothetical protein
MQQHTYCGIRREIKKISGKCGIEGKKPVSFIRKSGTTKNKKEIARNTYTLHEL